MDTLIHADIFFFVTTVVSVVLAILLAFLIYFATKAVRNIYSITETVKKESEHIVEDLAALRQKFKEDTMNMSGFGGLLRKLFMGGSFIRRAVKKAGKKTEEKES